MALIISVTNEKGGVGKSTVSINLAGILSNKMDTVLLIDADPQGTTRDWHTRRMEQPSGNIKHSNITVPAETLSSKELLHNIPEESDNYSLIIIDCGPAHDKITRAALAISHLGIIPITPSPYDIISAKKTINLIKEGKDSSALEVQPYLLISRKIVGTNLGEEVKDSLKVFKIPIFKTEICQRISLCEAGIEGKTIDEYAPNNKAASEFEKLGKEVKKWARQNYQT